MGIVIPIPQSREGNLPLETKDLRDSPSSRERGTPRNHPSVEGLDWFFSILVRDSEKGLKRARGFILCRFLMAQSRPC